MFTAFSRAYAQLGDRAFRKPLWNGLALTLAAFIVAAILGWKGLQMIPESGLEWLDAAVDILSGVGLAVAMALLFPGIATAFTGLFLDDAALAVEQRHYPSEPPGQPLELWDGIGQTLRFGAVVLALNLLALPFYILLIWFPPFGLFLYYGLNGYLFGREYFELVAARHHSKREVQSLRKQFAFRLFLVGCVIAFLFTIPVINLFTPLVATAAMVHVYKQLIAIS